MWNSLSVSPFAGPHRQRLNLPLENRLWAQPAEVQERIVATVDEFAYGMLTVVFNAADTAPRR